MLPIRAVCVRTSHSSTNSYNHSVGKIFFFSKYKCYPPYNTTVRDKHHSYYYCPASQVKRRPKCDRIAPSHPLSWPCVSDLLLLKGESWQRAFATLDDSTPQRRISELRVWSYEPFIVFAPSSSGYLSGQYLEVLYIIRNSIWNIFKIIQKIIKKYEIVLKQQLDTVSYLEEQKISAGLHLEINNKSLLALRRY